MKRKAAKTSKPMPTQQKPLTPAQVRRLERMSQTPAEESPTPAQVRRLERMFLKGYRNFEAVRLPKLEAAVHDLKRKRAEEALLFAEIKKGLWAMTVLLRVKEFIDEGRRVARVVQAIRAARAARAARVTTGAK